MTTANNVTYVLDGRRRYRSDSRRTYTIDDRNTYAEGS